MSIFKLPLLAILAGVCLLAAQAYGAPSVDQCDTTAECKTTFGARATDCLNSQATDSVCMCSSVRCDAPVSSSSSSKSSSSKSSSSRSSSSISSSSSSKFYPVLPHKVNLPGRIQAENYNNAFDTTLGNANTAAFSCTYYGFNVDVSNSSQGGCAVGWTSAGETLDFAIGNADGTYDMSLSVASALAGKRVRVWADGQILGTITTTSTGWSDWEEKALTKINLATNTRLTVEFVDGGVNLDYIDIKNSNALPNIIGKFDTNTDLLLANFDSKPDVDDIHAVAALATVLKDPRYANVKYHAVLGAFGRQSANLHFVDSHELFSISFPSSNWSHLVNNPTSTLNTVVTKVIDTLKAGGDVWIQEAGQSDFSAKVVRRVKTDYPSGDTKNKIHIVQYSEWNENQTTPVDLSYVKSNTDYSKIQDGSTLGNGIPNYNQNAPSNWGIAINSLSVGAIWKKAQSLANQFNNTAGHNNIMIANGGFDFSDNVEAAWIFGYLNVGTVDAFFTEFVKDAIDANPPATTYAEANGIVAVELETTAAPSGWKKVTGSGSVGTGFMNWLGGDNFNAISDSATITVPVRINSAGRYVLEMRSIITSGDSLTDANDVWIKILAPKFYAVQDGTNHVVCPRGMDASNSCIGALPNGAGGSGWFKVYRSGGSVNTFNWSTFTSDNDPHKIYADFPSAGVYKVLFSGRSNHHGLDRFVLYRAGNASNNVDAITAQNSAESAKQ